MDKHWHLRAHEGDVKTAGECLKSSHDFSPQVASVLLSAESCVLLLNVCKSVVMHVRKCAKIFVVAKESHK